MMRTLVLVGLPGAGKTMVGEALASRTKQPFIDTDREIERASGQSIAELFANIGESGFRSLEQDVVLKTVTRTGLVIALGGGAFANLAVRQEIRRSCTSIWLDPPIGVIHRRIAEAGHRPLLSGTDRHQVLDALAIARRASYAQADFRIEATELDEILAEIVRQLVSTRPHS